MSGEVGGDGSTTIDKFAIIVPGSRDRLHVAVVTSETTPANDAGCVWSHSYVYEKGKEQVYLYLHTAIRPFR